MASRTGLDRYSCAGSLDAPVGDCHRRPTKALFCYAVLNDAGDAVDQADLEELAREPVPAIFTACPRHLPPIVAWAETLWSEIADGTIVPIRAVDDLRVEIGSDTGPQRINPHPDTAVGVHLAA